MSFALLVMCLQFGVSRVRAESIPDSEVHSLASTLKRASGAASSVEVRRACKHVIRRAQALLEATPDASNRFAMMEVLLQAQKRLLTLEANEQNRRALFATCEVFLEAPDDYAESRLEADLLLSERDLGAAGATVAERVKALKEIVGKYEGTPAERRCLTLAALIASKLQAFDFQEEIRERLSDSSFGGDHEAIAFRRKTHSVNKLDAVFSGTYERVDGPSITFPFDRMGHQYLVIFWSENPDGFESAEVFLARVREQQERFAGSFETYSFNLDKLPDAGKSLLVKAGVKCTALHLPEGRSSSVYKAYALADPVALFVNAQGHVALQRGRVVPWPPANPARGTVPANPGPGLGMWLDTGRYVTQLRSLFIGDFLVASGKGQESAPAFASELAQIEGCFVPAPFRYRLSPEQALANYRKAEKLCGAAIRKHPNSPGVWQARNPRIIALLGLSNLSADPSYLEEAKKEAEMVLGRDLPPGKDVVARFCLAKAKLRAGDARANAVLSELIEAAGGEDAPAAALAAAAILCVEANAEILYQGFRQRFLDACDEDDPALWPVLSFMRDRHHGYRLFWGNPGRWGYTRQQRYKARQLIAGFGAPSAPKHSLAAELRELDGQELRIPRDTKGETTGVVFVEPPETESDRSACVKRLQDFAGQFTKQDVPVVVAFLSEDVKTVGALLKECGGSFRAALVPGGLKNPLVRRLGILASDRIPNPFLLGDDGTIAWWVSGLTYPVEHTSMEGAISAAIEINIEKLRTDHAFKVLEQGDFKRALQLLDERLPPKRGTDAWTADRLHGRALAHMGLNEWGAALGDIDAAIAERKSASRYGPQVTAGVVEMHDLRATILKRLGRVEEAAEEMVAVGRDLDWLEKAPEPEYPPSYARNGIPVGVYDDLLSSVRVHLEEKM